MKAREFTDTANPKEDFIDMFGRFLPLAMDIIGLESLPQIKFDLEIGGTDQPTFGKYINSEHVLHVALANRHPVDILRTIAHELQHYKQDLENQLNDESGVTGSPEENEANQVAGIVMRHFNKQYPQFLRIKPIVVQ